MPLAPWIVTAATVLHCSVAAAVALEQPPAEETRPAPRPAIYDEQADARAQLDEALARARRENRRVLIQWGANWCGWCHLLHEHFQADRAVARALLYEYDLVLVDIGRWNRNLDLAEKYGAAFRTGGVPYLTVLSADGAVVANQETGALEKPKGEGPAGHDGAKVLEFLTRHQAPYRAAEDVLKEGLDLAKAESKLVFLHFGAPWCGWCHRLERWMAREDVARVLKKAFVDVKVDVDRTIGGDALMKRFTKGQTKGIPWFAFLRPDGTVVAAGEDQSGANLGCPHAPEEVIAFKAILSRLGTALSAGEIEAICAHLGERAKGAE
jgi:thiol:disulfide interchange protein